MSFLQKHKADTVLKTEDNGSAIGNKFKRTRRIVIIGIEPGFSYGLVPKFQMDGTSWNWFFAHSVSLPDVFDHSFFPNRAFLPRHGSTLSMNNRGLTSVCSKGVAIDGFHGRRRFIQGIAEAGTNKKSSHMFENSFPTRDTRTRSMSLKCWRNP